ncbi:MAG: hypothetical protein K2R98_28695 [Gemmataceae bacterium]|nr:hypothetical protein [Gemmataceae bacterium]
MSKFVTAMAAVVVMLGLAGAVRAENTTKEKAPTVKAPAAASAGQLTLKFDASKSEGELSRRGGWGGRGYGGYGRSCGYSCYSSCYYPCYNYSYCYTPCYSYSYYPCYSYCYSPCCYYSCCGTIGTLSAGKATTTTATVERTDATLKLPASLVK